MTLEEGSRPYPRCPQYDMFLPQKALNVWNLTNILYRQGMERKWNRLEEEDVREGMERALTDYVLTLFQVTSFKYLVRVLEEEDDDWPAVIRNLRRIRQKWAQMNWVLSREGADARKLGHI